MTRNELVSLGEDVVLTAFRRCERVKESRATPVSLAYLLDSDGDSKVERSVIGQ
jgi:hypothetical protein